MPSDVRVFVRFKDQAVFAGEELHCVITFKNVADLIQTPAAKPSHPTHAKGNSIHQLVAAAQARQAQDALALRSPTLARTEQRGRHQGSSSLNVPLTAASRGPSPSGEAIPAIKPIHKHQRSVSIISGNLTSPLSSNANRDGRAASGPAKPFGHRRSSTVQVADNKLKQPQPQRTLSTDFHNQRPIGRRSPLSASHSPTSPDRELSSAFKFPGEPLSAVSSNVSMPPSSFPPRASPNHSIPRNPHERSISVASRADTVRTSVDIYNSSNHSDETLTSEYPAHNSSQSRIQARTPSEMLKQQYKTGAPISHRSQTATLLMGYAQVQGSFTLDASLVDQSPFEDIKKKGFLGGQSGGGVVGAKKKTRPSSGLFGGLGFGSISESLEGILGSSNASSTQEMKAVASSRAIPLLSTPQSLLFVNLNLEPGEEKSYSFSIDIPLGLPASHRGKVIKVIYNLVIGTQAAPGKDSKSIAPDLRQISIPFRLFPGVDSTDGEIMGHDLMQPHVLLRDIARTKSLAYRNEAHLEQEASQQNDLASEAKFLDLVDTLLDHKRRRMSVSSNIFDPSQFSPGMSTHPNHIDTTKVIERTLAHANRQQDGSVASPNTFEITSDNSHIATLILNRSLHRLGETITLVADFSHSELTTAVLSCVLESSETVDPSIATRSASTIARLSRKIHGNASQNVMFCERAVCTLTIPVNFSPTFITTGIRHEWAIRVEFLVVKQGVQAENVEKEADDKGDESDETDTMRNETRGIQKPDLLEELHTDEKGTISVAVESLDCESFEVSIPITVYGALVDEGTGKGDDVSGIPM